MLSGKITSFYYAKKLLTPLKFLRFKYIINMFIFFRVCNSNLIVQNKNFIKDAYYRKCGIKRTPWGSFLLPEKQNI